MEWMSWIDGEWSLFRWSSWKLEAPSCLKTQVDVADIASLGTAAGLPVNLTVDGGYFSTKLRGSYDVELAGWGGGVSAALGWGVPALRERMFGKVSGVIGRLAGAAESTTVQGLLSLLDIGTVGGSRLIYGPAAPVGEMTALDFEGFVTLLQLDANFGPNGITVGLVIFSKVPLTPSVWSLLDVTAFGAFGGPNIAASLEAGGGAGIYRVRMTK